jgi:hypothetical protein
MATVAKGKPRAGKRVVAVEPVTVEEMIEKIEEIRKPETVDQKLERIKAIEDEISEMIPVEFVGRDAELTDQIYGVEKPAPRVRTDVLPEKNGDGTGDLGTLQRFINLYQPGEIVSRQMFRNLLLDCLNDWEKR